MQDYKNTLVENIPYLRRYARALTDNMRLADRMVQQCIDCAMDLHQLIKKEQDKATNQKIWLFSIFHNIYNDFITEQHTMLAQLPYDNLPDSDEFDDTYENDQYHRAFLQLPLQQKQIFLLISVEKFLYEEVSEIVNLPLGAILSLLHTARNSIAEKVYRVGEKPATDMSVATKTTSQVKAEIDNDEAVEMW